MHGGSLLSVFAPFHARFSFENIDDRLLRTMMMDSSARSRLDQKYSAPHPGADARRGADRCQPQRTRCLQGSFGELLRGDNLNGG